MASSVRIKINIAGFNAYRNNDSVTALITEYAREIQQNAQANADGDFSRPVDENDPDTGRDFAVRIRHSRSRVQAYVATSTFKGELAEAKDRALTRAVQAH